MKNCQCVLGREEQRGFISCWTIVLYCLYFVYLLTDYLFSVYLFNVLFIIVYGYIIYS